MATPDNAGIPPHQQDPAAQTRSRDHAADPFDDIPPPEENPLTRAEATFSLMTDWFADLQTLARAELGRSLSAALQILGLSLVLLPLVAGFILSLCAGLGLLAYYFFHSIYIAFAIFIVAQILLIAGTVMYQRKLRTLLGFDETRRQVKEAINDVAESLK